MTTSTFDTSIVTLIKNSVILEHKETWNIYLVNSWTCQLIALFDKESEIWVASTWAFKLNISSEDIDNITDLDEGSDWKVIA